VGESSRALQVHPAEAVPQRAALPVAPNNWNAGMMEYWVNGMMNDNSAKHKMCLFFQTHYSTLPLFHYSN